MPTFDPLVLQELADDMGGREHTTHIVERFRSLLPTRIRRVLAALADDDALGALDMVLSLKVTAAIVGGKALSAIAAETEVALRTGDLSRAKERGRALALAAQSLEADLDWWSRSAAAS